MLFRGASSFNQPLADWDIECDEQAPDVLTAQLPSISHFGFNV
jgi:hypothetical protein